MANSRLNMILFRVVTKDQWRHNQSVTRNEPGGVFSNAMSLRDTLLEFDKWNNPWQQDVNEYTI